MDIEALLQVFSKKGGPKQALRGTPAGALLTAAYGLPYAQWVAEGKGFGVIEATATAAVAALPTTTSGIALQNGEADTGKWYVIHSVFAECEASAAAVETAHIAGVVGMNRVAAATRDLALTSIKPLLGGYGPYDGLAIVDLAASVIDDLWRPLGPHVSNAVASNGEFSIHYVLDGLIVLKPQAQLGLELLATTTGVTGRLGAIWFEVDRDELIG